MSDQDFAKAAELYAAVAQELEMAARHSWLASEHMKAREVPRACAHAFAATGHMRVADERLGEMAKFHAAHSSAD